MSEHFHEALHCPRLGCVFHEVSEWLVEAQVCVLYQKLYCVCLLPNIAMAATVLCFSFQLRENPSGVLSKHFHCFSLSFETGYS